MKSVHNVSVYTLKENARSRSFSLSVIFVVFVFASAFLFSRLSEVVETRVIRDVGMGAIQFFSLLAALFFAIKVAFTEGANKTIYLPLSRPVKRWQYLSGRFLGIVAVVFLEILMMGALLTGLLLLKNAPLDGFYFLGYLFIFLKIVTITSVGILLSLVSTSFVSPFVFTFLIWITGHLFREFDYLIGKMPSLAVIFLKVAKWIIPNFTILNIPDYVEGRFFQAGGYLPAILYAVFYTAAVLVISCAIFEKKEF
ncbi:MAG: ABC transporter permease subunit [Elusimicrobia bacterium]|nr:ABC transporter permease subunit [Elusimicrobiota bacterium]